MPALKQDLFRMLTLNSCRSTFLESFPVLLPKPESFQLFPQCSRTGLSSGPWVEISSGPWHCCTSSCCWDTQQSCPELCQRCCQGSVCGQIQTKGLGERKENTSDGRLCSPPGCLFTRQNYFSICLPGRGRERCGKSLLEHGYLLQLVLQGFWTTCLPFFTTRQA